MGTPWSQVEIKAVATKYFLLLDAEHSSVSESRAKTIADIKRRAPERTPGAIWFKLQNVSHVLKKREMPYHKPIPPRAGFTEGAEVQEALMIAVLLLAVKKGKLAADKLPANATDWQATDNRGEYERRVAILREKTNLPYPAGKQKPRRISRMRQIYERDPLVRAWVLQQAKGKCEKCGERGFLTRENTHYLEGHHVLPLAEGGPDTPDNTIALCANCHREAHHGQETTAIRQKLQRAVAKREAKRAKSKP